MVEFFSPNFKALRLEIIVRYIKRIKRCRLLHYLIERLENANVKLDFRRMS